MAAEREKVIADTDSLDVEKPLPERDQLHVEFAARLRGRQQSRLVRARSGQCGAVDFAGRG